MIGLRQSKKTRKALSFCLAVAMLVTSINVDFGGMQTTKQVSAATPGADYEILVNGESFQDGKYTVAYGDEVSLSLEECAHQDKVQYVWLPGNTVIKPTTTWKSDLDSYFKEGKYLCMEPGSYYLGYIYNDGSGEKSYNRTGFKLQVEKAQIAAPVVTWDVDEKNTNIYASWEMPTKTKTGGYLDDAILGFNLKFKKDGEDWSAGLTDNLAPNITKYRVDTITDKAKGGFAEYTFQVQALANESDRHYDSSSFSASDVFDYHDVDGPDVLEYEVADDKLSASVKDIDTGIKAYAFSTATSKDELTDEEWQKVSQDVGDTETYTYTPTTGGKFYFYAKDGYGNVSRSDNAINVTKIIYDGYSYSNKVAQKKVEYFFGDHAITLDSSPERRGFVFGGWFDQEKDGEEYSKIVTEKLGKTYHFYASWLAVEVGVTLSSSDMIDNKISRAYDGTESILKANVEEIDYDTLEYQWYLNGELIEGANESTYKVKNASDSGIYSVTVIAHIEGEDDKAGTSAKAVTVDISKLPLQIKGKNVAISYGDAAPVFEYEYTGFLDGENESDITVGEAKCDYKKGDAVKDYDITLDDTCGFAAKNYAFTFVNGTLHVVPRDVEEKKDVKVSLTLPDQGYTYDGEEHRPQVAVEDDNLKCTLKEYVDESTPYDYKVQYVENINAGENTAEVQVVFSGNYTGTISKSFSIKKDTYEITASIQDWKYGETPSTPSVSNNHGEASDVTYYYREVFADHSVSKWTDRQPVNAGNYQMYAKIAAVNNYESTASEPVDFTIQKRVVFLYTESGSWEHDGNAHSKPIVQLLPSYEGKAADGFAKTDGLKYAAAPVEVTDVCENVINKITYILTSATLERNYDLRLIEGKLSITKETLISPKSMNWDPDNPGTASWVAVSRSDLTVKYIVNLYRKSLEGDDVLVDTKEVSAISCDFSKQIQANSAEKGVGKYYFTVQTIPTGGAKIGNYSESKESDPSENLCTSRIAFSGQNGISKITVNGEERSSLDVISGQSYTLEATLSKGYAPGEHIWSSSASDEIVFENEGKLTSKFTFVQETNENATYQIYANGVDEMPIADIVFDSYGDKNKSVTLSLVGKDSKAVAGYYFGAFATKEAFEEYKESGVQWETSGIITTEIDGYQVLGINKTVTNSGHYYFGVLDDSGNESWVEEPYSIYDISFDKGSDDATGTMDSILKAQDQDIELPAHTFTMPSGEFLRWSADGLYYGDQETFTENQDKVLTALWNQTLYSYSVKFYYMDRDGEYTSATESETLIFSDIYGTVVPRTKSAFLKNKLGFHMDLDKTQESWTLTENGQEMSVYYEREKYNYTYKYKTPGSVDYETLANYSFYYGHDLKDLVEPDVQSLVGYSFGGWKYGDNGIKAETMPNADVVVTGSYHANTTNYYTHYYLLNEAGTAYEELTEEAGKYEGDHGESVTMTTQKDDPYMKVLEGCEIQGITTSLGGGNVVPSDLAESVTGEISEAEDKVLHINYYYKRLPYTVTLNVWKDNRKSDDNLIYKANWTYLYGHVFSGAETDAMANYYNDYVRKGETTTAVAQPEVSIQKDVSLDEYNLAYYEDWSCGGSPSKMAAGDISITRDYIYNDDVQYRVHVLFEEADHSYTEQGDLHYYAPKGSKIKIGDTSDCNLNVDNFSSLVLGFSYYSFDKTVDGSVVEAVVNDPTSPEGMTEFYVYFKRAVKKVTVRYFVQENKETPIDTSKTEPVATQVYEEVWGTVYDCDPLRYFDDNQTLGGKTYNFLSDEYVASYSGHYYINGDYYPQYSFKTEESLSSKPYMDANVAKGAITRIGQADSVINVFYTLPRPKDFFYLDVRKATEKNTAGTFVNQNYQKLTDKDGHKDEEEYDDSFDTIRIVNKAAIYKASFVSDVSYEKYKGGELINSHWEYETEGETQLLREGFTKVNKDSKYEYFTYTDPETGVNDKILYVIMDDSNGLYYGKYFGLSFNKDSYVYKLAKTYGDNYVLNGITGVNIYNNSASGIIYSGNTNFNFYYEQKNLYRVYHHVESKVCAGDTDGHVFAEGVPVTVKQMIEDPDCSLIGARDGYTLAWYTDPSCTTLLTEGLNSINADCHIYGRNAKKLLDYSMYKYYQLPDEVNIPGMADGDKTTYITADMDLQQLVESGVLTMKTSEGEAKQATDVTIATPYDYTEIINKYYYQGYLAVEEKQEKTYALNTISMSPENSESGYHFDTENTSNVLYGYCKNVGIDLCAYIARDNYNISVDKNNGDTVQEYTANERFGQHVSIDIPKRDGYQFAGWDSTNLPEDAVTENGKTKFVMPMSDITLKAQWEAIAGDYPVTHFYGDISHQYLVDLYEKICEATPEQKKDSNQVYFDGEKTDAVLVYDVTGEDLLGVVVTRDEQIDYYVPDEISGDKITISNMGLFATNNQVSLVTDKEASVDALVNDVPMFEMTHASYKYKGKVTNIEQDTFTTRYGMEFISYYERNSDCTLNLVAKATDNDKTGTVTIGGGTYIYGTRINAHATISDGYEFLGWYQAEDVLEDYVSGEDMDACKLKEDISEYSPLSTDTDYVHQIPGKENLVAVVKPYAVLDSDINVFEDSADYVYGYESSKSIKVVLELPDNTDPSVYIKGYQWYDSSDNPIAGATKTTYNFGTGLNQGSYTYTCKVFLARRDNDRVMEEVASVYTINVAAAELTVESEEYRGYYDAAEHHMDITRVIDVFGNELAADQYKIYYSETEITQANLAEARESNILKKDVKVQDGKVVPYEIHYYVVVTDEDIADNYVPCIGTENILIEPKEISVEATNKEFTKVFDKSAEVQGDVLTPGNDKYRLARGDDKGTYYKVSGLYPEDESEFILDFTATYNSSHVKEAGAISLTNLRVVNAQDTVLHQNYNYAFPTGTTLDLTGYIKQKMLNMTWAVDPADSSGELKEEDGVQKIYYAYTGEEHQPVASLLEDEGGSVSLTYSGSASHAGEYVAQAVIRKSPGADASVQPEDYLLKQEYCTFYVQDIALEISPVADSVTYDGDKHTLTQFVVTQGDSDEKMNSEEHPFQFQVNGVTYTFTAEVEDEYNEDSEKNAGEYHFTAKNIQIFNKESGQNVTDNFGITMGGDTLTIQPKEIVLSGIQVVEKEYDGTTDAQLDLSNIAYDGIVAGDSLSVDATKLHGTFELPNVGARQATVTIGEQALTGSSANNYIVNTTPITVDSKITKSSLALEPENIEMIYGDDVPFGIKTNGGFFGEDTKESVTVSGNVEFSVTDDSGKIKKYSYTIPAGTAIGDLEQGELAKAAYDDIKLIPGEYTVKVDLSGLVAADYSLKTTIETTLVVNKRPVTVSRKADSPDLSKVYDDATTMTRTQINQVVAGGYAGEYIAFEAYNEENHSGIISDDISSLAFDETNPFTAVYNDKHVNTANTITITNIKINNSYYEICYEDSDNKCVELPAVITPKELTLTAKAQSLTYGEAVDSSTWTVTVGNSQLIGNDTLESVCPNLTFTTDYDNTNEAKRQVGTYVITPVAGTITNGDYEVTAVDGELTVKKKKVIVTVNGVESILYGESVSRDIITATFAGWEYGEDETTAKWVDGKETLYFSLAGENTHDSASITPIYAGQWELLPVLTGEYAIEADNYSFENGVVQHLEVSKRPLKMLSTTGILTVGDRYYDGTTAVYSDQMGCMVSSYGELFESGEDTGLTEEDLEYLESLLVSDVMTIDANALVTADGFITGFAMDYSKTSFDTKDVVYDGDGTILEKPVTLDYKLITYLDKRYELKERQTEAPARILPKPLTIKAVPKETSILYGDSVPEVANDYDSFVEGEGSDDIPGFTGETWTWEYKAEATKYSPVSDTPYEVIPGGYGEEGSNQGNYNIHYENGKVLVTQNQLATPEVTWEEGTDALPGQVSFVGVLDIGDVVEDHYKITLKCKKNGEDEYSEVDLNASQAEAHENWITEDHGSVTTSPMEGGKTKYIVDLEDIIRENGAGAYKLTVQAIAKTDDDTNYNEDHKNVLDSEEGITSDDYFAVQVQIKWAEDDDTISANTKYAEDLSQDLGLKDPAVLSLILLEGEKDIPLQSVLKDKAATGYEFKGITAQSTTAANASAIAVGAGDKQYVAATEDTVATRTYDNTFAIKRSLASAESIDLCVALKAIAPQIEIKFEVDNHGDWYQIDDPTRAKVTYGYTGSGRPKFNAVISASKGDTIVTDDYTYSYTWYMRAKSTENFQAVDNTYIVSNGNQSTFTFPIGMGASDGYTIFCEISATRADNHETSYFYTTDEEFELANDGCLNVTVGRGGIDAQVALEGWKYGEQRNMPSVTGNVSGRDPIYYYGLSDNQDGEWSTTTNPENWSKTMPTDQGTYYVCALIPESENYQQTLIHPVQFTIEKAKLEKPVATLTTPLSGTYGDLSWTTSADVMENANTGDVSDSKVTPLYEVKVYYSNVALEKDSSAWATPVATYSGLEETTKNIASAFDAKGYYKVTVQAIANNDPDTKDNCFDSDMDVVLQKVDGHVDAQSYQKKYDGTPITLNADFEGTSLAEDASYQWYHNNEAILGANRSTYDVTYVEQNGYYYCVVQSGEDKYFTDYMKATITPRVITITSDTKDKVYDGTALTSHEFTVTGDGLAQGDSAILSFADTATRTEQGSVENTVEAVTIKKALGEDNYKVVYAEDSSNNNYEVAIENGTLTVNKKSLGTEAGYSEGIQVQDVEDVIYKAAEYQIEPVVTYITNEETITLVKDQDYTVSYNNNINVSTADSKAEIVITGMGNYQGTIIKKFNILPVNIVITSASDTKVYDKLPLTKKELLLDKLDGVQTNLIAGQKLSYSAGVFTGSRTNQGTSANSYNTSGVKIVTDDEDQTDVTANYNITFKQGTLTIEARDISQLIINPEQFEYQPGVSQGPTAVTVEALYKEAEGEEPAIYFVLESSDYTVSEIEAEQKVSKATDIGTYTYEVTGVGNYKGTLSKTYTIVDTEMPTITGVEDGHKYCGNQDVTITDKSLASIVINGTPVQFTGDTYTGTLVGTEEGTDYVIVVTDSSGNTKTITVKVYKDHSFTTFTKSEDGFTQTAPCDHECGATYTSYLPHGTISWDYNYSYDTLDGVHSGVQDKEARSTVVKVELVQSVAGVASSAAVIATKYVDCTSICGNVPDAASYGSTQYGFEKYDPSDNTKATGDAWIPVSNGDQEYVYSIRVTPENEVQPGQYVRAFDYRISYHENKIFDASVDYKPQLFDVPWKVTLTGLPEGVYPESISVKVLFADREDADDTESSTGYRIISQQVGVPGAVCEATVASGGSVSYEGKYPVWKFLGNRTDSYYHRILITGYTYKGEYYDVSGEESGSDFAYHQFKSENSAIDHETKTICYVVGTYRDELGTDDGHGSGTILYNIDRLPMPTVHFDYNDDNQPEKSTKPVEDILKTTLGQSVEATEIPGAAVEQGGVVAPVREHYRFLGWFTKPEGGTQVTRIDALNEAVTLYAHWQDICPPTGEIKILEKPEMSWDAFITPEDANFDRIFNQEINLEVTASDNKDEAPEIKYFLSEEPIALQELQDMPESDWTPYEAGVPLKTSGEYILYAKITDSTGNVTIISSQGIEVDLDNPVIKNVKQDTTYCLERTFTVTDKNLDKVTVNGEEIVLDANHQYKLTPSAEPYTVVALDKAGNTTTISGIIVNPEHTFGYVALGAEVIANCQVESCDLSTVEDMTVTLSLSDKTYDKEVYDKASLVISSRFTQEVIENGGRTTGIAYYAKDQQGEYHEIQAPTEAGTYYARALVYRDGVLEAASEYCKFVIRQVTLTVQAKDAYIDYLQPPTQDGVTVSGFLAGDDISILSGELTYDYDYEPGDDVGEYSIIPKGYSSDNYFLNYVNGVLHVAPIANQVSVTYTGKVYDGKELDIPAENVVRKGTGAYRVIYYEKNGEEYKEIPSPKDAGTYYAQVLVESDGNYLPVSSDIFPVEITKRPLTIQAKDTTINYLEQPRNQGVTYDNLVEGDTEASFEGTLVYAYNYKQGDLVGDYQITPSGVSSKNYEITFKPGTLKVIPKKNAAISIEDIKKLFGVSEAVAAQILEFAEKYGISWDTLKITDSYVTNRTTDDDMPGSGFHLLKALVKKTKKKSMILQWSKHTGADGYIIYASKCNSRGKIYKLKYMKTVNNKTFKYNMKKQKKGTYYKYVVLAYKNIGGKKITMAASVAVHATTKGGKWGIAKGVKLVKIGKQKKRLTKVTLKQNKTAKIKAKEIRKDKKIQKHRTICYESSNPKVATVTRKGKIKAVSKGTCQIWVYAQNGVYKTIRLKVK